MSKVVFTTIKSINDLDSAIWLKGDDDSYANTKRMCSDADGFRLIGRQDKYGRVQLCYASNHGACWALVNAWHLDLVRFFEKKLDQCPQSETLCEFFAEIDDAEAKKAAQQLIALECGVNVTKEPWGRLHYAVLNVQASLRALGLPAGDWSFTPMFNSFQIADA